MHPTINKRLNIVVTGGNRGLGAGLVKHFTQRGNKVYNISRKTCNVGNPKEFNDAIDYMHMNYFNNEPIHVWINNAASSGGYNKLVDLDVDKIGNIVATNVLGTIIGTKKAIEIMEVQSIPGYIYNVTGAGADYSNTPFFSVYGLTKSSIVQFTKSVASETTYVNTNLCLLSPGMLRTNLLLENVPKGLKHILQMVAEDPEYVASRLCDTISDVYWKNDCNKTNMMKKGDVKFIRFFDLKRVLERSVGLLPF